MVSLPVKITASLAVELVKNQCPASWGQLPIVPLPSAGTANSLFRLGADKVLRFPQTASARQALAKEQRWLPILGPHLPLAVPEPLFLGQPEADYPQPWAVYRWLEGQDFWTEPPYNLERVAQELAAFVLALRAQNPENGPPAGPHNACRGVPLNQRDQPVRQAIAELGHRVDGRAATQTWEALLEPVWDGAPLWLHGDLIPGNLLGQQGQFKAVIDFGLLGVGDAAVDLLPAWTLLDARSRDIFRERLQVDDGSWKRGQGWALYQALLILPFYWDSNPMLVAMARRVLQACGLSVYG